MVAEYVRFNRTRRGCSSATTRDRRSATGCTTGLLAAVHRAADRPPGVRRLVGRPASRCGRSRPASSSSSSPTTGCSACATARSGARSPVARSATSRRSRARRATACASARRSTRIQRHDDHVAVTPRGRRARALRRGRARDALRPGAARCSPMRRRPSARSSARSRTRPTRPSCTPTATCSRGAAAPGRAGTTTCSTSRPGCSTVTYHMNRLQALDADREYCVTLNRSERDRPGAGIRTIRYAHPVYTARGRRARRRATTRSAAATGRTSAAPTGAGASTRTASSAAQRVADALGRCAP